MIQNKRHPAFFLRLLMALFVLRFPLPLLFHNIQMALLKSAVSFAVLCLCLLIIPCPANGQMDRAMADIIPYLEYLTESFSNMAAEKNIRLVF